ncbi:DinB family protein [Ascidiimonas sp. W6]|uniref:DinB family protein n=1 Tax=Ascidiimonas meishanensis TaxID=3128903 RepID=UPI0030EECBEA
MNTTEQLAKHIKDVHFGGNWTASNLKEQLENVNLQQATTKIGDLNTIAVLVFHINYYANAITGVLKGKPLEAKDKYSFDLPPLHTEEEWQALVAKVLQQGLELSELVAKLPDSILAADFTDAKYGNYHRNFLGFIEHTHYHLGQISLLKKLAQTKTSS